MQILVNMEILWDWQMLVKWIWGCIRQVLEANIGDFANIGEFDNIVDLENIADFDNIEKYSNFMEL